MTDLTAMNGLMVAEAIAQSLESMAFVSTALAELPCAMPTDAVMIRLAFTGPVCGAFEMIAPRALGALLLTNISGASDVPIAADEAEDALKELVNVVSGALLRGQAGEAQFEMSLPNACALRVGQAWTDFVQSTDAVVIDAEGHLVAVRFVPSL